MKTTKTGLRPAVQFLLLEDQPWWKDIKDSYLIEYEYHDSLEPVFEHREKIRQYQKRQPIKDMFVRPEKPNEHNRKYILTFDLIDPGFDADLYNKDLQQRENWQPVFVDDIGNPIRLKMLGINMEIFVRTKRFAIELDGTLDDMIREMVYQASLYMKDRPFFHWNPDHEKVKGLFYPDIN